MPEILHDFPVFATPERVFAALSDPAGLDAWWSLRASGTPGPAGARPAPAAIGADTGAGLPGPGSINEEHGASLGAGRLPSPVAINESLQRDVNMSRAVLRRISRG